MNRQFKTLGLVFLMLFAFDNIEAQRDTQQLKAQVAVGVNMPSIDGFVEDFEPKPVNLPTVNLGVQYMFNYTVGAKVDFGFNRFVNEDNTPEFKVNYTRLNAQAVFDASQTMDFLPARLAPVFHAGPGYSWVKSLGDYPDNELAFFNVMAGMELHYDIKNTISIFVDGSYIMGFADEFDPVTDGYGSFNGDLFTVTLGVSFSLSGCYYCD